jgi:hypothetical protein
VVRRFELSKKQLIVAIGALVLSVAPLAEAADIYVNGEQVRGITNLTLEKCTVTFNARGDIYVTAPGFKVHPTAATGEQTTGKVAAKPQSLLENRYFLFTQTSSPGEVPFSFEVWVNDEKIKEFSSSQDKLTVEVTLHLKPGSNKVEIKSIYQASTRGGAADSFSVLVGRGAPNAGSLEINKLLLNYTRKGNDSGDAADVYYIDVK